MISFKFIDEEISIIQSVFSYLLSGRIFILGLISKNSVSNQLFIEVFPEEIPPKNIKVIFFKSISISISIFFLLFNNKFYHLKIFFYILK